jgi:hypothetical protein
MITFCVLLLALLLFLPAKSLVTPIIPGKSCKAKKSRNILSVVLPRQDWTEDANNDKLKFADYGDEALLQAPKQRRGLTIPVLPTIPNAKPLMMGSSLLLDPPTLGQWQALEESVILHQNYLSGANLTAIIDAAPLIAVMDDYTVSEKQAMMSSRSSPLHKTKRRYATLAAVVGISSTASQTETEWDFMERLAMVCSGIAILPFKSKIRLVGVGRAELIDFYYQMPSTTIPVVRPDSLNGESNKDDECTIIWDGPLITNSVTEETNDDDNEDDEPPPISNERPDPIVMAEFTILQDEPKSSIQTITKGIRSNHMAPVFAINEMAKYANKVTRLHDERRRLVRCLADIKRQLASYNIYDDIDGLGSVLLEGDLMAETDRLVMQCDNYGLNYYSSLSSIPDLTGVTQQILEQYYSPERRSTEEYRLEILSFVAFRSLEGYCSTSDMAWALLCTNSIERLQRAYQLMEDHYWSLKDMIQMAEQDLSMTCSNDDECQTENNII